jgi:putative Mg2+ transporter-C (MgtC) family protein
MVVHDDRAFPDSSCETIHHMLLPFDQVIEIAVRLLAAVLIGGCIGIDREIRRKPAGIRTHALVSLGAALVMLIVVRTGPGVIEHVDAVSRAIQGIIAGVGFLGGGAILKSSEHDIVHGLTTAASIWLVASLGIACGVGQWVAALIALALALLVLVVGEPVERLVHRIGYRKPPPDEDVQDFTRG